MLPVQRKPAEVSPTRMGALAKLPIFLDLDGKHAVVAGGTAAAAWKAELLAAAGAHVEIYAAHLADEMSSLIHRGVAVGAITHAGLHWTPEILAGAAIALADADGEQEAASFAEAARQSGVQCNVIDKPAFCQFQFGSIVNRSPVVIGISTDGAAPILGQAIRRRIETLLPPTMADWGRLAKALRGFVSDRLPNGPQRRTFWEALAERAFAGPAPTMDAASSFEALATKLVGGGGRQGRVTLVGAGPGDAELLTLKAVRAMQAADVILYDDLVSDDVLELARREAKRILVGKRGQRESCAQEDINDLMVKLARQGKHVVRLKSGDPMIFGRAGEEIERLDSEGIAVSIVPGVTSASAMASQLGISLTHRDCASSVRFITAHAQSGELPDDFDWPGLADARTTLIVYMGARTSAVLASR
jgi:uroporphyrin-III C-methyltransferase/precorrin-2 dehydrogenase/sirohydrochlorin ferrochelatase